MRAGKIPEMSACAAFDTQNPEWGPDKLVDKTYCEYLLDALALVADPAAKELFVKERRNPDMDAWHRNRFM